MKPSFVDNPRKSSSPAVNKYLQHLQSKNDPRQTIATAPITRTVSNKSSSSSSSQSNDPSTTTTATTSSTAPYQHSTDSGSVAVDVAMPTRSTLHSTHTTHPEKRKPRRPQDKPPLGHKHPRSIISILTNTTYLSSDSEGEDSTATATVHSDGTSLGSSIGRRRKHRRSTGDDSRSSGTSPSFPTNPDAERGALIPFQPKDDDDDATDHPYLSSNYTANSQSYDEEEEDGHHHHMEHDAFSYSSGDEEDDTLNQLIAETSARWKLAVHETVQSTTTSAAFSSSSHMVSSLLQVQYASSPVSSERRPVIPSLFSADVSNRTASNDTGFPAPATSSQLIQEQQAEIEALRAALQRQQQPTASSAPVHPIQILTVPPSDPHGVEDDLTVWSGFHSTAPPPLSQRPDAEASDTKSTPKLVRAPRLPPAAPTSLRLELSSTVTGLHRSALFTGTIASQQPPMPDASFRTRANHYVTGTGVLQFLATGDVYRGELVHSELHGVGTYTFAKDEKVLRGRFEHNVFIGE
jgi:hypothetical protein